MGDEYGATATEILERKLDGQSWKKEGDGAALAGVVPLAEHFVAILGDVLSRRV